MLDEVSGGYNKENDADTKIQSKQQTLTAVYDQASKFSQEAEALELSRTKTKAKYDVLTRSILLWESQIEELKGKSKMLKLNKLTQKQ